ncbi:MAG: phosphomannomutase/phosphoglucomutase, partial [Hasllibacter sp.]
MILAADGFRDYDARWRTPEGIDADGMERVGLALAAMLHRRAGRPRVVTGRDWRSYSEALHGALIAGLVRGGCRVLDCGVALSPIVYDAWARTGAEGCAMLTASHNPAGWTGVKMGAGPAPLTFGPAEMDELRDLALTGAPGAAPGGGVAPHDAAGPWADAIAAEGGLIRPLKVVIACGSGTAGFFAPDLIARLGARVVPLACEPDWDFPHHHPNPDDPAMQAAM